MVQDQVEEIKQKTDIVELISEYVKLSRSGRNFKALCPFHSEKTPSFMVSPELGIFKCFGCGVGGDVYRFLQEYEKIEFPQALKILADRAGVKLKAFRGQRGYEEKEELYRANYLSCEFYHYLLTSHETGKKALSYLRGRGITREAQDFFRLGYAPDRPDALSLFLGKKGYKQDFLAKAGLALRKQGKVFDRFRDRIIFPLHDHFGNVLGFAGRVLRQKGELAKYINTPDTAVYKKSRHLYGLHLTKQDIKEAGFAVLVEGELDCISSWQVGVRNVAAIKGSALTPEQAQLVSRFSQEVRLATDSDEAGLEAARRAAEVAQKEGLLVKVVSLGRYKDPDEACKDASFWQRAVIQAQEVYDFLIEQSFKKYDATSTEGKARISRELIPVLAGIDDEIVKAAQVKKLAESLGVSQEAVTAQLGKQVKTPSDQATQRPGGKKEDRTRREILEEYLLSLAFSGNPKILMTEVTDLFKSPASSRLLAHFQDWSKKGSAFDPSEFAEGLPAELVDFFAGLVLVEVPYSEDQDIAHEAARVKKELEMLNLREEMSQLGEKIRRLEQEKKTKKLASLEKKLARTGERLAKLELGIR